MYNSYVMSKQSMYVYLVVAESTTTSEWHAARIIAVSSTAVCTGCSSGSRDAVVEEEEEVEGDWVGCMMPTGTNYKRVRV